MDAYKYINANVRKYLNSKSVEDIKALVKFLSITSNLKYSESFEITNKNNYLVKIFFSA